MSKSMLLMMHMSKHECVPSNSFRMHAMNYRTKEAKQTPWPLCIRHCLLNLRYDVIPRDCFTVQNEKPFSRELLASLLTVLHAWPHYEAL